LAQAADACFVCSRAQRGCSQQRIYLRGRRATRSARGDPCSTAVRRLLTALQAFLTGFTGSAGCAVVTNEKATLSTDGRYFNQAEHQLDSNWELLKQGMPDVPTWQEWAVDQAQGGKTVGVDATLITARTTPNQHSPPPPPPPPPPHNVC
jgi:hypothetical protein